MSANQKLSPPPTPDTTDIEGLLWGYRFSEAGQAELLQGAALRAALERQEVWIWLHFDLGDERARDAIAALPHVPPAAVAMLLSADDRQHIETFGPAICGVVADYERGDTLDVRRAMHWHFLMAPHLFVSARRMPGHALHQLRLDLGAGRNFPDVVSLFNAIIHEFTSATGLLLWNLSTQLDEMEEALFDGKDVTPQALGTARRALVRLRRQAKPLHGMLIHIVTEPPDWFTEEAAKDCHSAAERLDSLTDDLDALQDRAHTLFDELTAIGSEKTNKRLTVLSIVSGLLLPPTFISGMFGMNVGGLPFTQSAFGFWGACGLMAVSATGMLILLRRLRLI